MLNVEQMIWKSCWLWYSEMIIEVELSKDEDLVIISCCEWMKMDNLDWREGNSILWMMKSMLNDWNGFNENGGILMEEVRESKWRVEGQMMEKYDDEDDKDEDEDLHWNRDSNDDEGGMVMFNGMERDECQ